MKKNITILAALILLSACQKDEFVGQVVENSPYHLLGGETSIDANHSNAFGLPAPNLDAQNLALHNEGDARFNDKFVSAPAQINPGLGPLFNNRSCIACHVLDGRSGLQTNFNTPGFMLLRLSMPGQNAHGGPLPIPGFGDQLQDQAIFGYQPEGKINLEWTYQTEYLADGTTINLRQPNISIRNPYQALPAGHMISARMPMPVFGLGLLEEIPVDQIMAKQDIDDRNQDGISGKANWVWDPISQSQQLGRFGWKANVSNLLHQNAAAYANDMGIANPIDMAGKSSPDISMETLKNVTLYTQTLAVPMARDQHQPNVVAGKRLFEKINCQDCHAGPYRTGPSKTPALAGQKIYPFTDMLLHDMGPDLADNRPDFLASGQEWRTRPLWGLGLSIKINGHQNFLHDGRAQSIEEAILWHGGEAIASKNAYKKLNKFERSYLISFLESL
jgi:CxxC motif-containing protein (DUF1111 family)